jgi:hypothetical protein
MRILRGTWVGPDHCPWAAVRAASVSHVQEWTGARAGRATTRAAAVSSSTTSSRLSRAEREAERLRVENVRFNPNGYWYRLHDAPWSEAYYVAANTFWNGDVPGQTPYTHNTDFAVPNC